MGTTLVAASLHPGVARAADDESAAVPVEAQEHYTAGREAYRAGLYGRALEAFERSLSLAPSPNTRLYIARTLRELGRWSEAEAQFRATAREAEERGGKYAPTREAADVELRDVQVRLARDPSRGRDDGGGAVTGRAPASPALAPAEPAAAPDLGGPADGASGLASIRPITWVSGGVAVAAAATFGILYGLAGDRYGYLEDHCRVVRSGACDDASSAGQSYETVGYVALGLAAAAAAVAVTTLLLPRTRAPRAGVASALAPPPPLVPGAWRIAF